MDLFSGCVGYLFGYLLFYREDFCTLNWKLCLFLDLVVVLTAKFNINRCSLSFTKKKTNETRKITLRADASNSKACNHN